MFPALLTTILFALTAICATQSSINYGPERANLGRLAIAVILLGAWAHLFGSGLGGGQLGTLMLAGMIGFGAGGWCMFQAFPRLGSTISLLSVECSAAVVSLVLGILFFGAGISLIQAVCIGLCIGGVILALGPFKILDTAPAVRLAGIGFTVVAAIGQGISWTLTKSVFMHFKETGIVVDSLSAAYQRLIGGVILSFLIVAVTLLKREPEKSGRGATAPTVQGIHPSIWILGNALTGPVLGVSCMLWAIRQVDNPGLVQTVVATATLFTVPMAWKLENRSFRWNYYLGFIIALTGVAGLVLSVPR